MDCLLQNLALFLLLFQPQHDELIPSAPEEDPWEFRKCSGWMKSIHTDGTAKIWGLTNLSPIPGILQLSRTWKKTNEYSSFLKKLSVFPITCFSYINSCKVCSHGGRELVWTSFHSLHCRYKLSHLLSMCIPCWKEICLFCCLIPHFWKFSKYPLTHLTSTTCIHRFSLQGFICILRVRFLNS